MHHDPYKALNVAAAEAFARKRQRQVMQELRNALARAVKQADRDHLMAPVATLRIKG